ncbi:ADP-ribosylglycohydrolase family protein [Chroococcidiopsis sp. CCMEE 29]|uniref:ADP-ribosylglycohydrolase family protein n=1 Tax=Chroococcidiopsis sp. CCMEE 29 TaxID=155894 RepID=UPI002022139A|nr:ADP-ribosylglycohydrolase family protein [Chroococcidiopsis sp. CCMEE 29]
MRYSLGSRFRGTLLGAAIGEKIEKASSFRQRLSSQEQPLAQSLEQQNLPVSSESQLVRLTIQGTKSLIRQGKFNLNDWQDALATNSGSVFQTSPSEQKVINEISTTAIITTLPIALFYHENEIKLRQNLQLALGAVGQDDPESWDGALAVGYAIAQSLKEKLYLADLIPQIISFLGESQTHTRQKLKHVKTLLEQNVGLEQAATELSQDVQPSSAIALAFYCFLSTLEDFRLSTIRAACKSVQPRLTSAITGALSGAYNSTSGIPASVRLELFRTDTQLAGSGMTAETEMLELSDSLVAVWSGVYDQANHEAELTQIAAIAAPRTIRLR